MLSRSEHEPEGNVSPRRVEEVFVRVAPIVHLHVGEQVIRTTPEHPFYVLGRGWTKAGELHIGDWLATLDGPPVRVDDFCDAGETATVYNFRIEEFHTYFVGKDEWSFSVWAHNAEYHSQILRKTMEGAGKEAKDGEAAAHLVPTGAWSRRNQAARAAVERVQKRSMTQVLVSITQRMDFLLIPHDIWAHIPIGFSFFSIAKLRILQEKGERSSRSSTR